MNLNCTKQLLNLSVPIDYYPFQQVLAKQWFQSGKYVRLGNCTRMGVKLPYCTCSI